MVQQITPGGQTLWTAFDYSVLPAADRRIVEASAAEIQKRLRKSAEDIVAIGTELLAVKERIGHGNWLPWLEAEFGWSDETARKFMRTAEKFQDCWDLPIAPSALYLLARDSTPDEVREEAIARAQAGEKITHAEAKRMVEAFKEESAEPKIVLPYHDAVDKLRESVWRLREHWPESHMAMFPEMLDSLATEARIEADLKWADQCPATGARHEWANNSDGAYCINCRKLDIGKKMVLLREAIANLKLVNLESLSIEALREVHNLALEAQNMAAEEVLRMERLIGSELAKMEA